VRPRLATALRIQDSAKRELGMRPFRGASSGIETTAGDSRTVGVEDSSEGLIYEAKVLTFKAVNSVSGPERIRLLRTGPDSYAGQQK